MLKEVRSPPTLWVASTNLSRDLLSAIQRSFLSLRDTTVLAEIGRGLTGFRPTSAAEYDALERDIEKAKRFDEPKP